MKRVIKTVLAVSSIILLMVPPAQSQAPTGTIKGKIVDYSTQESLIGVAAMISSLNIGDASDENGEFLIKNVPVGSYSVTFQQIGYQKLKMPDIIIRSGKITFVNAELRQSVIESDDVVVTTGYYNKDEIEPTSVVNFNAEEIRRAPGSAGDISRVLLALPSTAMLADNANDLAVRGGSPSENGFFVDNIQINNINHYPVQGSSGGPIGLLNVDFIEDVTFHAGGFSAAYGDRLSSVMSIDFREGNTEEYDAKAGLSMGDVGITLEGPIIKGKGSFFISARESYLDLIAEAISTEAAPRYGDFHSKATYDINASNKITFLNIVGHSTISYDTDDAIDLGVSEYGDYTAYTGTSGFNWKSLWSKKGYSNTSISYSLTQCDMKWFDISDNHLLYDNKYLEGKARIHNVNHYQINSRNNIQFGVNGEYEMADYDNFVAEDYNRLGDIVPEMIIDDNFNSWKSGAFVSYSIKPVNRLTTTLGARADYFSHNEHLHVSPRFSTSYRLSDRLSLNGSAGLFYQNLPMCILAQNYDFKELKDPRAIHYVLGLEYMLNEDTRLTIEAYDKEYEHLPLDTSDPAKFVIDDGSSFGDRWGEYGELVDVGKAYTRGIEVMVQKKLAHKLYGLASGSFFRSRYKDLNGQWRDRVYDNKYIFSLIGGYKPNNRYEFSAKWIFAGGVPYTPFDQELSHQYNTGIIDINQYNSKRYPDYHSLNIRFDKRYHYKNSCIVTYFSLWNVYDRKNVTSYLWDRHDNEMETMYGWRFIPIGGFEYEF